LKPFTVVAKERATSIMKIMRNIIIVLKAKQLENGESEGSMRPRRREFLEGEDIATRDDFPDS